MKLESIIIYPKNAKQKTLLKSLLEEMKIQFGNFESLGVQMFHTASTFLGPGPWGGGRSGVGW
jgi:hypothetical protein